MEESHKRRSLEGKGSCQVRKTVCFLGGTVDSVVLWWQDAGSDCTLSSPSMSRTMCCSVPSFPARLQASAGALPAWRTTITPKNKPWKNNNTQSSRGTHSTYIHLTTPRVGGNETRRGMKRGCWGAINSPWSLSVVSAPSASSNGSQMATAFWCQCGLISPPSLRQEAGLWGSWERFYSELDGTSTVAGGGTLNDEAISWRLTENNFVRKMT